MTRTTDDVTKVKISPTTADTVDYKSKTVGAADFKYGEWTTQTLTRGGSDTAGLLTPEEATVYTNIENATPRKLTYGGDEPTGAATIPAPSADVSIVLTDNKDVSMLHVSADTARTFTGTISGASGTFTCAASQACAEIVPSENAGGQMILTTVLTDWTFVSNSVVESAALQDENYMFFGYWLREPADLR